MRAYLTLLRGPGVPRLVVVAIISRIASPMISLSLLLAVQRMTGSYADGGAVLAGYAAALALFVPISGRLIDRMRPRGVLLACLAVNVVAYAVVITALTTNAPLALVIAGTLLLGASTPPGAPVVRANWSNVVPEERLQTAFALDAVLNEAMVVSGPLLVSLLLTFGSPVLAIAVAGVATTVGILLLATTSVATRKGEGKAGSRRVLGPLAHAQVLILLGIMVCDLFAYSCIIVGIAAAATEQNNQDLAGVLLAVGSAGAVLSGLVYGARERSDKPGRQLVAFHAAGAVLLAVASLVSPLLVLGLLMIMVGLVGGPRDTLHQLVLSDAAPEGHRTEVFAWLITFMWVGYGLGTALAGQLVTAADGDAQPAFVAAAVAAAIASATALFVRTKTRTPAAG